MWDERDRERQKRLSLELRGLLARINRIGRILTEVVNRKREDK